MSSRQQKRESLNYYLQTKVSSIVERMMVELLAAKPQSIVDWCISWLDTKGRVLERNQTPNQQKDQAPKQQKVKSPKQQKVESIKEKKIIEKYSESEEGDEDEEIDDLPANLQNKMKAGVMRTSVSAEVYGQFNKKEDFKPRVIEKGEDQKERIIKRLMQSFMFQALEDKERDIVVMAMEEKKYAPGDVIINQGEDGDNLYVCDSGELDCYKTFKKEDGDIYLKVLLNTYQPGESFGELALLYNAPRAATIKAKKDSILFALDRATFNNIVKDAAVRKREKYEEVLKNIDLLASMDPYERTHVCDGLKAEKYKEGDYVIKQGEQGDKFYMIEEGELKAIKEENGEEKEVLRYKNGDYFGELALMKDIPRQASVIALTDVKLVYLDQQAFKRLLGPLDNILKRNLQKYEQYLQNQ